MHEAQIITYNVYGRTVGRIEIGGVGLDVELAIREMVAMGMVKHGG